ncbi:hypothetical protein [Embleya sp. NPDC050493]|uniref:hypothetical protein n=1 Tax=Embleya sp. NPDC050493 TaxID=3363989 RepID=UPI003796822D
MTETTAAAPCLLCREPSVEAIPTARPTTEDQPRPEVPLCVPCRRQVVAGAIVLGWCPTGRHHGLRFTRCAEHRASFGE